MIAGGQVMESVSGPDSPTSSHHTTQLVEPENAKRSSGGWSVTTNVRTLVRKRLGFDLVEDRDRQAVKF